MTSSAIEVAGVNKTYGTLAAVRDLGFSVTSGASFGLLGPNGAGKTTMMRMIYGRCRRDAQPKSRIEVFGYDPARDELAIRNLSGVVPQEDNLDNELNVGQNLMIYARLYGISPRVAEGRIDELLQFMELGEKKTSKIRELSGGMKRRLIIARALINSPRLLILDEPTTGLDPQVRHAIWEKIRRLKQQGMTVLLTTHYMEEAFQICDTVLIMHKGRKVIEDAPRKLVAENIEEFVLELIRPEAECEMEDRLDRSTVRTEETSRNVKLFYSNNLDALRTLTNCLQPGDYILRQSNLEDVFLKTTGRDLGEATS
jgi:lipooligosaccharide transport system ATP-binding protein